MDEPYEVIDQVEAEVAAPAENNFKAHSMQVRSKLGNQLYGLIEKDLPGFYEKIRDAALGESKDIPRNANGKPSRSYGSFLTAHRRMFIDLMKMANADVSVDHAEFKGDVDIFHQQLSKLTTDELRRLSEVVDD